MATSCSHPSCSFAVYNKVQVIDICSKANYYLTAPRWKPLTASKIDVDNCSGFSGSSCSPFCEFVPGSQSRRRGQYRCSAEGNGTNQVSDDFKEASQPGRNPVPSEGARYRSKLEHLFHSNTAVPEEEIEKPLAVAGMMVKSIGNKPPCNTCRCVGIVECGTCEASGLYVEPILESQGVIVKVRCMGCGGSGSLMCSSCGGRGHL